MAATPSRQSSSQLGILGIGSRRMGSLSSHRSRSFCEIRPEDEQGENTEDDVIFAMSDGALPSPGAVKCECFEWGCGFKILEKPRLLRGKKIKQIALAGSHAVALLTSGEVYTWGKGRCGQLGHGTDVRTVEQPTPVRELQSRIITRVWAGLTQTAMHTRNGTLLFYGLVSLQPAFEAKSFSHFDGGHVKDVAFGPGSCAVLVSLPTESEGGWKMASRNASVFAWGHSRKGHLGFGDIQNIDEPTELECLRGVGVVSLSGGEMHMAATTAKGDLYMWGTAMGIGNGPDEVIPYPSKALCLDAQFVKKAVCGSGVTLALTRDGNLYSWGVGRYGMTGHGNMEDYEFPGLVMALQGKHIVGVSCGGTHICAWTADGRVYAWGSNRGYRTGHREERNYPVPSLVEELADGKIVLDVSCGSNRTAALVMRDIIRVSFRGHVSSLPVNSYPFIGHVVRKLSQHYQLPQKEVFMVDKEGLELSASASVRDLKADGNMTFRLFKIPCLFDYASPTLLFQDCPQSQHSRDSIPQVKGATVENLIKWLTFSSSTGHEFLSTFLLTYRTFMTSEELMAMLVARYENPDVPESLVEAEGLTVTSFQPPSHAEMVKFVRLRVLNTVKRWLSNHVDNFIGHDPTELVERLKEFVEEGPAEDFPRETGHVQRLISTLLEPGKADQSNVGIQVYPDTPCPGQPRHDNEWDIYKYSAEEFARQLTIIDYYLFFKLIQPGELIGQAWSKKNKKERAPNVLNMIHRFNLVSEWVAKEILTGATGADRKRITELFIDIADECFKLNNFNLVMSILSAFTTSSLHRLQSLWDAKLGGISSASQQKLRALQTKLSVEKNMQSYRELFKSVSPPKIPFLGMYLQDLTFIDDGNNDFIDEEKGIINFDKRMKLATIISVIQRLQQEPYKLAPIHEMVENLRDLQGFEGDHEATAYKISKHIESKSGELSNDDVTTLGITGSALQRTASLPTSTPLVVDEEFEKRAVLAASSYNDVRSARRSLEKTDIP